MIIDLRLNTCFTHSAVSERDCDAGPAVRRFDGPRESDDDENDKIRRPPYTLYTAPLPPAVAPRRSHAYGDARLNDTFRSRRSFGRSLKCHSASTATPSSKRSPSVDIILVNEFAMNRKFAKSTSHRGVASSIRPSGSNQTIPHPTQYSTVI